MKFVYKSRGNICTGKGEEGKEGKGRGKRGGDAVSWQ